MPHEVNLHHSYQVPGHGGERPDEEWIAQIHPYESSPLLLLVSFHKEKSLIQKCIRFDNNPFRQTNENLIENEQAVLWYLFRSLRRILTLSALGWLGRWTYAYVYVDNTLPSDIRQLHQLKMSLHNCFPIRDGALYHGSNNSIGSIVRFSILKHELYVMSLVEHVLFIWSKSLLKRHLKFFFA